MCQKCHTITPDAMNTIPKPKNNSVVWTLPDIGTALSDAPASPAPATINVAVVVCVVPAAV